MSILVSQVVAEGVVNQTADIRVSQVVAEDLAIQNPSIRVSQVVWECVIVPASSPVVLVSSPALVAATGGGARQAGATECTPYHDLMSGAQHLIREAEDCIPSEVLAAIGWEWNRKK